MGAGTSVLATADAPLLFEAVGASSHRIAGAVVFGVSGGLCGALNARPALWCVEQVEAALHPALRDLAVQLVAVRADYDAVRTLAREAEARGYDALLASTEFSERARELQNRAVLLLDEAARALRFREESRDLRLRFCQASERLAALFGDGAAEQARRPGHFDSRSREPTLSNLLFALDRVDAVLRGMGLQ